MPKRYAGELRRAACERMLAGEKAGALARSSGFLREPAGPRVEVLDVEPVDEHGDPPAGVGVADSDVVEDAPVAQHHSPGLVDAIDATRICELLIDLRVRSTEAKTFQGAFPAPFGE